MIIAIGALLGVLAEAFVPRIQRFNVQISLTAVVIVAALGFTGRNWFDPNARHLAGLTALSLDAATTVCWAGLLIFALGAVVLASQRFGPDRKAEIHGASSFTPMAVAVPGSPEERDAESRGAEHTEVFPIMLFALFGMLLFPAATDLVTAFVGLEVMSLPLYLLCGLARRRRMLSHEAALKYFLLGAFSSAIFVYGAALTYGFAGGLDYASINDALGQTLSYEPLMLTGFGLLMVGMLFKVGAVPFHTWVPDVYTGAPTPVTAYMSVGVKLASFGALARLLYVAFGGLAWTWAVPLGIVAAVTMAWGSIVGLSQTNIKRLLSYSSIAHAGFILVPLAAAVGAVGVGELSSMTAVVYYLGAYGMATLGAFSVVMLVRDGAGEMPELTAWAGLGRRSPWLAGAMTLFLCSMAGIPVTAGFIGKLDAFVVAWRGGLWWLVLLGLVFSLVAMVFYMRVIVVMWFGQPAAVEESDDGTIQATPAGAARPSIALAVVIGLCAAGTVLAGVLPDLFAHVASLTGQLLR
ncbi:MAG: NADH-quinone oxidoreductase subunit NuoN [Propionibacteriaceae bacterium]|nr:NADH-quinone oxidoreductase subunit NuoN [Propionibacteriaceae bacterium]